MIACGEFIKKERKNMFEYKENVMLKPWNESTIPKNRPIYVCERTKSGFNNKWDNGISCLVVCIGAGGVNIFFPSVPEAVQKQIPYDELAQKWMEVNGSPCGEIISIYD
ncbi:MAG: hypothetical protein ACOCWG_02060 [bacterium]